MRRSINVYYICSGFCSKCATQLEICPLCRKPIEQVDIDPTSSSATSKASSDHYLRPQLSHDKPMVVSERDEQSPVTNHSNNDDSIK